jgi:predicted ATPase
VEAVLGAQGVERANASAPAADVQPEFSALEAIARLADNNLIQPAEVDGESRFTLLATIREVAAEQLRDSEEAPGVEQAHAICYLELAEAAEPNLSGAEQERWMERLERDHNNLMAALHELLAAGRAQTALRLCGALWRF